MTYQQVMLELQKLGIDQTRKIYLNHGADIPMFGVSMANIKLLAKKNKNNHDLGRELFFTNNVDAIYLSQFLVDSKQLTIEDFESIILKTHYYMILDNSVANIVAKNEQLSYECIAKWIAHTDSRFRQVAYSVYTLILGSYENDIIDKLDVHRKVLYVKEHIHQEENRVRYSMNNFLIQSAVTFPEFVEEFKGYAKEIGKVVVVMGNTACKVPDAASYIEKIQHMGNVGKKRKL